MVSQFFPPVPVGLRGPFRPRFGDGNGDGVAVFALGRAGDDLSHATNGEMLIVGPLVGGLLGPVKRWRLAPNFFGA
jgi:hypothetical protein